MKGIRFDISDELHCKLRTKLASEGRQANELFITLTELYVSEGNGKTKKNRPQKSDSKKQEKEV